MQPVVAASCRAYGRVMSRSIVIIGGGFGGVCLAQRLCADAQLDVTLISDRPWLEYYGALYRLLREQALSHVCVPLSQLVPPSCRVVIDTITSLQPAERRVTGERGTYSYDDLVLAVGAEPAFFGIPGMQEYAHTMKDSRDALRLKATIDDLVRQVSAEATPRPRQVVVVGAGPTGTEASAELLVRAHELLQACGCPKHLVQVTLVEAFDRVLPSLPAAVSPAVQERLTSLGVHVLLQKKVTQCTPKSLELADGTLEADLVVWTAGVQGHKLVGSLPGVTLDKRHRALVEASLQVVGVPNVYVMGDAAATVYAGMAQTAVYDAGFLSSILRHQVASYAAPAPKFAVPVGRFWAAVSLGRINVCGRLGYLLREAADLKVFLLLLPPLKAVRQFLGLHDPDLEKLVRQHAQG